MEIAKELEKLGLKPKEAQIFLAALELGITSISAISKKAGVKRPTTYHIIGSLIEQGLVAKVPHGKRLLYAAESPERLARMLDERRQVFGRLLPALDALYRAKPSQPNVRFYEGKEGLRAVYEEFFKTHKTLYTMVSVDDVLSIFSEPENAQLFELLRTSGGRLMDLVRSTPAGREYAESSYRKGVSRIKFLPENFELLIDLLVTDERVAFFSFRSLLAVVIDDQAIAKTQKAMLQFIWQHAGNKK